MMKTTDAGIKDENESLTAGGTPSGILIPHPFNSNNDKIRTVTNPTTIDVSNPEVPNPATSIPTSGLYCVKQNAPIDVTVFVHLFA